MKLATVLAGVLLAATGCAWTTTPAGPGHTGGPYPTAEPTGWQSYAADIGGVTPGPGARSVTIDITPRDKDVCLRNVVVDILDQLPDVIHANVVDEVAALPAAGCPQPQPTTATLTASAPIGGRLVVLNTFAFKLTGGEYHPCGEYSLCNPPADHCDPQWIMFTANGLDVPAHSGRDVEHCDQRWMVLAIDANGGACPAGATACSAPPRVTRYYLRWQDDGGWQEMLQTTGGGCDQILRVAPTFPSAICRDLAPTAGDTPTGHGSR